LCHGAHFTGHPGGEDFPTLLFAEARAWEVALLDKGDNVDNDLVVIQDRIDDDGNDGGEIGFASNFHEDHDKATGLEDSAEVYVSKGMASKMKDLPSA
jgi:hypothetical protein